MKLLVAAFLTASVGLGVSACTTLGEARGTAVVVEDGWKPFRDVRGHSGCEILEGPTSLVRCADGWTSES